MTTAVDRPKTQSEVEAQQWLHMYRRMVMIRLFEEQVNDLYTRALMPGLAHLYIGEEAVAVGVCEALEPNDYITSTHRGHGHCLAKGATLDKMFAELLGKEAGRRPFRKTFEDRSSRGVFLRRRRAWTRLAI